MPTVPQHDQSINISHDLHADRTDEYSRETSEPDATQSLPPAYVVSACSNKDDDHLTTICAHCSSRHIATRNSCPGCPSVCTLCSTAGHRQKRGDRQFRECGNCKAVACARAFESCGKCSIASRKPCARVRPSRTYGTGLGKMWCMIQCIS